MNNFFYISVSVYNHLRNFSNLTQPLFHLGVRFYLAWVFFASGLTKIEDWETTLWLFEEEYSVPFLNYQVAAFLGTAGELILPVMLVLGFGARFAAIGLSIVNLVAVISLADIAPAAYILHVLWGILLLHIVLFGAGYISIDRWVRAKVTVRARVELDNVS